MPDRIVVVQGHPAPAGGHLLNALADAYARGAEGAGRQVRRIEVARLDFPLLRTKAEFDAKDLPPDIAAAQEAIAWADHLVLLYPLWLGTMPALLKAFLEQVFRPAFAFAPEARGKMWSPRLRGRSARIVVTMGMPAWFYRWFFGAHGLKSLERNILKFSGIKPIAESLFGMVEAVDDAKRKTWIEGMERLGREGR